MKKLVTIFKFQFYYNLKFKDDLFNLGIKDVFDENADFSKMVKTSLYISDALHKANIELTEKGVKAAVVTVFAMTKSAYIWSQGQLIDIIIDKPFMFIDKK